MYYDIIGWDADITIHLKPLSKILRIFVTSCFPLSVHTGDIAPEPATTQRPPVVTPGNLSKYDVGLWLVFFCTHRIVWYSKH